MRLFRSETPPPPGKLDFGTPPQAGRPTAAQLKADIDAGLTGDKAPHGDVGASPLGTCEEAAGTPPSVGEVLTARRNEAAAPRVRAMVDPHGERGFVMPLFWLTTGGIAGLLCLGLLVF